MRKKLEGFSFDKLTFAVKYDGYSLKYVNFINCNLHASLFTDATLNTVTFNNCNLQGSVFNAASLFKVQFINCSLNKSQFEDAKLEQVRFRNKNNGTMENANFTNAILKNSRFQHVSLREASFGGSFNKHTKFINTLLQDADLGHTEWVDCSWKQLTLYRTTLSGVSFTGHCFDTVDFRPSRLQDIIIADGVDKTSISNSSTTKKPTATKYTTTLRNTFFRDAQTRHIKVKADNMRLAFQPNHLTIWYVYLPLMNLLFNQKIPVLNIMAMLQWLAVEGIPNNLGKNLPDVVFNHDYSTLINTDNTRPQLPDYDAEKNMVKSVTRHDTWKHAGRHEKLLIIQEMFFRLKPLKNSVGLPPQFEKNARQQIDRLKDLYVRFAIKFKDCNFVRYQVAKDANSKHSVINFNSGWSCGETSTFNRLLNDFKEDIVEFAQDIHPLLRLR